MDKVFDWLTLTQRYGLANEVVPKCSFTYVDKSGTPPAAWPGPIKFFFLK